MEKVIDVKSDHIDEILNCVCIDAWFKEEGTTAARIDLSDGRVFPGNPDYFLDEKVQDEILRVKGEIRTGKLIGNMVNIPWTDGDVIHLAKQRDIELTEKQTKNVLRYIKNKNDASIGVSWADVDYWIDLVLD